MGTPSKYGLENNGLRNLNMIYWTLPTPALIERVISRREGMLTHEGSIVVNSGQHTGRSVNDKFVVKEESTGDDIWWGEINKPISPENFDRLYLRLTAYFQGRDVFVQDTTAGAHADHKLNVRIITAEAAHSLFARNMFIRKPDSELADHVPDFTVLQAPGFHAIPSEEGTNSETFIVINFEKRLVLIGGTCFSGEIKKSIFSVLNYLLPKKDILPMHCSANVSMDGETALFFGLSGTGKTTLSSDPDRLLVGDDEHGWGKDGIFNFEGGCYAKTIRLDPKLEPLIYDASQRFGTILENVVFDPITRRVDFDDGSLTENARSSYPVGFLPNSVPSGKAGHPNHVFFLTADAFGVLPPISKLTPEQAIYYFISGYTSKLGGTEKGLGKEPLATFSACFGAPFLPLHPKIYGDLLMEKITENKSQVWLVNTGWSGGPYGVGERMSLPYTRAMITAALNGELDECKLSQDKYFGLFVPENVPNVPNEILNPRETWDDKNAFDASAKNLVDLFKKNIGEFSDGLSAEIIGAGPQ
ncbi:MAG: phosphoenolpyruvate carboxykinase (ATP) [Chloroflexi bacterium]|nr:phosphoenolpyruvate carboxykinase (ATP) [Chloroflexota bacterium]MBT3669424.1 phosphoenolpyruvate carboxykinase (ATP) [Chloroflexota bacterium]MBT4003987.1 phosphoenolpyruvate carboxykinase (ATP) [Chloroflexota bacterium]MBT4304557.1 phosphoenolpyruvate carboxykinase (ATP) [Chloroflexota bacterium]MBT4534102.1 phosphoenolpyruvate carboxykinase (ATP) [Chloroflexota bacterium]